MTVKKASHQHWVQTGPHVMIVGPAVREMGGYPRSVDVPDPTQPYAMFPGTPYEHLVRRQPAGPPQDVSKALSWIQP